MQPRADAVRSDGYGLLRVLLAQLFVIKDLAGEQAAKHKNMCKHHARTQNMLQCACCTTLVVVTGPSGSLRHQNGEPCKLMLAISAVLESDLSLT